MSDLKWSDVVPNYDSLPSGMQQWLTENLPTFIEQAIKKGLEEHHWGVSVGGNSYHLVGIDHTHAIGGYHSEVVGDEKTEIHQGGRSSHNKKHEQTIIDGNRVHQVNGHHFQQTGGNSFSQIRGNHNSQIAGDYAVSTHGNHAQLMGSYTSIVAPANTDMTLVMASKKVNGSSSYVVNGTHFQQLQSRVTSIGGPLASPPVASPASTQVATESEEPPAPAQQPSSNSTSKNVFTDVNFAWTAMTSGAASIVSAGMAFMSSPTLPVVDTDSIEGSTVTTVTGAETKTVMQTGATSFLGGTDDMVVKSASDTTLGMSSDTVIGLAMDSVIGLDMPFTLVSMGQVILAIDEIVCEVESKSFKLDLATMKITSAGAALVAEIAEATEAAEAAAKAEEAAKAAEDAVKATEDVEKAAKALEDSEKAAKAADDAAKLSKTTTEASQKALEASRAAEQTAKEAEDAAKVADDAAKVSKEAEQAAKDAEQASKEAEQALENAKAEEKFAEDANAAAWFKGSTKDDLLAAQTKTMIQAGKVATKAEEVARTSEAAAKAAEDAAEAAKASEKAAETAETAKATEQAAKDAEQAAKEAETAAKESDAAKEAKLAEDAKQESQIAKAEEHFAAEDAAKAAEASKVAQKSLAEMLIKGLPIIEKTLVKAGMTVEQATLAAKAIKTVKKVATTIYSSVTKYQKRK